MDPVLSNIDRPFQLVLIRHAESARNKAKRGNIYFTDDETRAKVKGIPDHEIPITETGITQARDTGLALWARHGLPDYIYHSGYLRTIQTMEQILGASSRQGDLKQIKIRESMFIRERDPGFAYDMTTQEAERHFPWLKEYWQTFGGWFGRPPGGESLADVAKRVYQFLNMLFRDRRGRIVWVITHGGTLRAFRFLLERWTYKQAFGWPEGQSPENCGITTYNYDKEQGRLLLSSYNQVLWK